MKLVTYRTNGNDFFGIIHPDDERFLINIKEAVTSTGASLGLAATRTLDSFCSVQQFIEGGPEILQYARDLISKIRIDSPLVLPLSTIQIRAPIPTPVQFRDCLLFEQHLINSFAALRKTLAAQAPDPEAAMKEYDERRLYHVPEIWYQLPVYYKANRFSFIGPNQDIIWPSYSNRLDYELEYAAVLSKSVKNATLEEAEDAIFGYTIFNDVSARDTQAREMQAQLGPSKGKDFDTGNVIGPCIVTKDAFDPSNSAMYARINGETVSEGNTGSAYWDFPQVISHASQCETLMAGEFFGSGTVGGGCALENGRFLQPGDTIELEVAGIGILRNKVVRR